MSAAASAQAAGARWYLVQAQTGREQLAREHLARQNYKPFLPLTWRSIRHARKIRTEHTAFFPGYLFVKLDLAQDRWRPIDGTLGVVRIVKADGRPTPAPAGLVETLIDLVGEDGALDLAGSELQAGAKVRIIRGPFADQIATVAALQSQDRVHVLLSMMKQSVPIECSRRDLALA